MSLPTPMPIADATPGIPTELLAALCAAGGAIVGGAVTGLFELFRDWFCRPTLRIACEGTEANRMRSGDQIYIRIKVENTGRRPAKQAMAFLTSVMKIGAGVPEKSLLHDSLRLHWAGGIFTRDVPPCRSGRRAVPLYVDLVKFYKGKDEWEFCVEQLFLSYSDLKIFTGTYRFGVTITADNAEPETCNVEVYFDGDRITVQGVEAITGWKKETPQTA